MQFGYYIYHPRLQQPGLLRVVDAMTVIIPYFSEFPNSEAHILSHRTFCHQVCIVDAARPLVKALMGVGDVALIGVWVSLDSIEAIEDRIRTTLASGARARDSPDLDSDVRGMVRQAVDDIEFGVMSGVFDFTVINNSDEQESMETIRRAVEFATTA